MSCKDCVHRHRLCHKDCPEYAEFKEKRAEIARAKEKARIGKCTEGGNKSFHAHQKYLYHNRNRKEYR